MIFHGNTRKPPMQKFKMPKILCLRMPNYFSDINLKTIGGATNSQLSGKTKCFIGSIDTKMDFKTKSRHLRMSHFIPQWGVRFFKAINN